MPRRVWGEDMSYDLSYTEGVIAARDKYLLKDRVLRLCEMTAEDAFRSLLEYGFGGGAETAAVIHDYEKLIAYEDSALDAFILEYAPSKAEANYFLSARDFHNAKALLKAKLLGADTEKLLAPRGLMEIEVLAACVQSGDYDGLSAMPRLRSACLEAEELLAQDGAVKGKEIGIIFERAMYKHLLERCRFNGALKRSLMAKIDMTNLLTAFRSQGEEDFIAAFIDGGKLKADDVLSAKAEGLKDTRAYLLYPDFLQLCRTAQERGLPLTMPEKYRDEYDVEKLSENRFELKANEPFLYYVLRRKAENANVRIIFALQLLGASEQEMKRRLRGI